MRIESKSSGVMKLMSRVAHLDEFGSPGNQIGCLEIFFSLPASGREMLRFFGGSFLGDTKWSCLFWEEDWETMTADRNWEKMISLVHGSTIKCHLRFIHDNAPYHSALSIRRELQDRALFLLAGLHSSLISTGSSLLDLGWKNSSKSNILAPMAGNDYHLRSFAQC